MFDIAGLKRRYAGFEKVPTAELLARIAEETQVTDRLWALIPADRREDFCAVLARFGWTAEFDALVARNMAEIEEEL